MRNYEYICDGDLKILDLETFRNQDVKNSGCEIKISSSFLECIIKSDDKLYKERFVEKSMEYYDEIKEFGKLFSV